MPTNNVQHGIVTVGDMVGIGTAFGLITHPSWHEYAHSLNAYAAEWAPTVGILWILIQAVWMSLKIARGKA